MRKTFQPTIAWGGNVALRVILAVTLASFGVVATAHGKQYRTVDLKLPPATQTWQPTTPPPYPVNAADYSGHGVNIGIVETGFGYGENSPHAPALSGVIKAQVTPFDPVDRPHGSIVARIVAGQEIGDGYGRGVAYESHLYTAQYSPHPSMMPYNDFQRFAVNVVNHSWIWDGPIKARLNQLHASRDQASLQALTRDHTRVFRRAVHNSNQLLVWAVGNDNNAQPNWPARLPVVAPELEKGWLAVTSIHPGGTLKFPANGCGAAANWCLSAVEGNSGSGAGTSYAAPVVTGIAALVREAYPWMDNHALRQTLLSTADNLGSPEIYGWGRVNADRAVRGPALFDSRLTFGGDFVADFERRRSEFFHDIGGNRGLVKSGNGTLVMWGKNTYSGATLIQGGILELYGRLAGNVAVGPGATLVSDGGTVAGNVHNGGSIVVMGNGLHIKGDYLTVRDGAEIVMPLGVVLTVDGGADISNSFLDILPADPSYVGETSAILLQAGNVVGRFDVGTRMNFFLRAEAVYYSTKVEVLVDRKDVSMVAKQYFQHHTIWQAAATAVETGFTAIDEGLQGMPVTVSEEFVAEAGVFQQISSPTVLATTLDSLTGEVYASSQALTFQQAQLVNRALAHRVDALSQREQADGLWVAMLSADGKLRQRGYTGANTRLFGAQLGADTRLRHDAIAGAAFSWSDANASFHGLGGRSRGHSKALSLYGRYGAPTGNYLAGRIGHDWITTDVSRDIVIGRTKSIASTRHDGMASAYAESGRVIASGQSTYTPFLGLEYNRLRRGDFKETGSAFALRAPSAKYEQGAASLGMRYQSAPIVWAAGDITLTAAGAYRYANATALDFTAAFNGASDATFRLKGIGLSRHSGWLSLGAFTRSRSRDLHWFVNVDMQLDHRGVDGTAVSAGLRFEFT